MKKIILLTCAIVAFCYSVYWTISNNGEIERYSATATTLLGLLTIYFQFFDKNEKVKNINHVQENIGSANNEQEVDGITGSTDQKNWFSFGNKQKIKK